MSLSCTSFQACWKRTSEAFTRPMKIACTYDVGMILFFSALTPYSSCWDSLSSNCPHGYMGCLQVKNGRTSMRHLWITQLTSQCTDGLLAQSAGFGRDWGGGQYNTPASDLLHPYFCVVCFCHDLSPEEKMCMNIFAQWVHRAVHDCVFRTGLLVWHHQTACFHP